MTNRTGASDTALRALHLGLVGCGSMAGTVLRAVRAAGVPLAMVTVLARPGRNVAQVAQRLGLEPERVSVVFDVAGLIACAPHVVAECASQEAVRDVVPALLAARIETVVASVGALAQAETLARIAAADTGTLRVAAGAVGGMDALEAVRLSGLHAVTYVGRKPPAAWPGGYTDNAVVFEGSAREAALKFPRNANVAATVALAGLGFDATQVRLLADRECTNNVHEITFSGRCANGFFRMEGLPSPDNPRTSLTAGYSVARCVLASIGSCLAFS
ncbi:aspartate dehydrogenase [Acetobacter sp. TBRC 12305]|uniref:L-aspartate dehydrogenase n=1 Tax=Acetobacter garciniae TaxID=2817435 RepID=A0A939KRB3_9PROT|nr:aspartate dehydrogenase [Acetobacter garciniae]MBO1326679.1 aspartate dehydrogenase [Acetobacter garciniae]MBX0345026.1 aspartate dehydrogenase [Acetobacter garciniae]